MGKKADAKDWKAVTFDWTDLQEYDHVEPVPVCLTQRQVAVLKALLTTAYWSTRWTRLTATPDELDDFVSQIDYLLDGNDCEGEMLIFRDNPNDPCEVQYSNNGGASWNTMFRKDNCPPGTSETVVTNWYVNQTSVENHYITYAGDIINVAPDWEYTDPDQDNALCWSIQMWVDFLCDFAITQIETNNQNRRDENDWLDELAPAVSAIVVAMFVALIGTVVIIPAAVIGGVTYSLTLLLNDFLDTLINETSDAYRDQDARDIVKCYMYQEITGSTPQWAAWSASLSNWETFGGNVKTIAETVNISNNHEKTYVEWMILTQDINTIADVLPPCPCPSTWEHTWDIENVGIEAWILDNLGAAQGPYGLYVPGAGVQCVHGVIPNGWHWNSVYYLVLDETVENIQSIKVYYDAVKGDWDSNGNFLTLNLQGVGSGEWTQGNLSTGDDQDKTYLAGAPGEASRVAIFYRVADYEPGPEKDNGSGTITKITLGGVGIDPFAGRDTD